MIAVATENGSLLRVIAQSPESLGSAALSTFGFHRLFGFISQAAAEDRVRSRERHGLSHRHNQWLCRFQIQPSKGSFQLKPLENCQASAVSDGTWKLITPTGVFSVTNQQAQVAPARLAEATYEDDHLWIPLAVAALMLVIVFLGLPKAPPEVVQAPEVMEPITVKVMPERQQSVQVPAHIAETLPQVAEQLKKGGKGAVAQNLGFLGILGKKDLKGALGGIPSRLENVSPGAGPGGPGGSGGEMLVGLGQGVKRTTVGNTGTVGLGGLSTKMGGPGGGAGGYGNTMIGSGTGPGVGYGNGKGAISAIALSQDIVLEGGLDRAVIQATIAKYLHEVRACYEQGLRSNPGLQGQITMGFEINPSGALNYSKVQKSTLGNAQVESCVAGRMMGWQFPKPVGGVSQKVSYPFLLRPVNG